MTRGQDRCIYVFTTREFEELHDRMRQAPLASKQARDYMRVFLSGANAETPDKQHRITIRRRSEPTRASTASSRSSARAAASRSGTPARGTSTSPPTRARSPTPRRR
ncbi:cell division protein MraZ [Clavibacter michiganensis subsp. michiganensis]|uniref:Cell division protein MraZ n=1 Tax=Clavibacter michiganensis subsp. michiganensis TaxID=33013 RepID=A0A251XHT5_CLAMM|nr:cell division protein MraZ [Clavibacter michiganensis subsp. michiganensis]OUE02600.1 cell division protein MraZ [Clavibacter michiganensis subsp. michiganensis]